MIGRVSEEIIREGRESILSRALTAMTPGDAKSLEKLGMDARKALSVLLDYITSEQAADSTGEILVKDASLLSERDIPWASIAGLVGALSRGILDYLVEQGGETEIGRIYHELIGAQARLFESYLNGEREKRERVGRLQREIDRFPDTIAATLDPPTLAKIGLSRLKDLVRVKECTLFSVEAERRLVPLSGDLASGIPEFPPLVLAGLAAVKLLEKGEPYWEDKKREDSCLKGLRAERGLDSILLLPLVVRGRTTGVVILSDGPGFRRFTPEEIETAWSFASRLAVAMENAQLHSKEQHKIKETVALLEIARVINSTLDLQEILDKVVQMTVDLCGVVLCVVYLLEEGHGRFVPGAYRGFIEDMLWEEERASGFHIASLGDELRALLEKGEPVALPSSDENNLIPAEVMYEHGVDLVLMFPLSSREKLTGVFALFYPRKEGVLNREEIEVVRAIAAQASMAIENAALYEDIEKSYFSTVKALAKAIEVKDPYTHGHSERVTEYALMIAEAMQLNERDKQKLKYAATLHDIGKIGIAGRVLNKAGALTDEEYTHVKTHPLLGDTIIEPVEFLQGPRPIILHHHERYDGKGYPDGLKGPLIPLCARILAVADAFEAMRSDRPYRRALPLETAKEELKRNAGTQFDPEVVEVFLSILERGEGDPVNGE
jgi:HD-GYP domain-containing protein (c-di-GMP phosphodiesterase class II)